ncbi:hypothetical protein [Kitasatospora nipponensis]
MVLISEAVLVVGGPAALALGGAPVGGRVLSRLRRAVSAGPPGR